MGNGSVRICDPEIICGKKLVQFNPYIPDVLKEWREPKHEAFGARNVWSLCNAFTETLKQASLAELPKRTHALNGLVDVAGGLN
jgi:hypothetical protein